ncbi:MAG TPA: hypothetical protein VFP84_08440 [Kofleriaceae bacterium]|nr:hypothetical protein [Kofleriaceae bacterium]
MRALLTLAILLPMAGVAAAQPADPYANPPASGPTPVPVPVAPPPATAADPAMADRVATALVDRAQELLDTKSYLDAKQLAVESLVRSPRGPAADHARKIIHAVNLQLGIPEDAPKPPPPPPPAPPKKDDVDTSKIEDPTLSTTPAPAPETGLPSPKLAASVHGAIYAGLIGTTIGAFFSDATPAKGAVPMGIAIGAAGALVLPRVVDRLGWTEAQTRTVGSATIWGGAIGGFAAHVADTEGITAREVLVTASITATVAGAGGLLLNQNRPLTRGDVALVDTFAGIGAAGGLTIGMLMQPARHAAYSLNAILGISGGVVGGLIAAPQVNTTPRRMLRVAGLAALGGGAPFLLYAAIRDPNSKADERVTGALASIGLVAGAYLGFRLTHGMDDGLDTLDGKKHDADDAPPAIVGRSSTGQWGLGGLGVQPLSPQLSSQHGMSFSLLGGAF